MIDIESKMDMEYSKRTHPVHPGNNKVETKYKVHFKQK